MFEFVENNSGIFILLGLVLAGLPLLYQMRRDRIKDTAEDLCEPSIRDGLFSRRNQNIGTAYFAALTWLNTSADRFYGDGLITVRAFERCLLLALIYPILGVLLAWVAFDVHTPGGLALFQSDPQLLDRIWKAAVLVGAIGLMGYVYSKFEAINARVHEFLIIGINKLTTPTGFLSKAVGVVSWLITLGGVVLVVVGGVVLVVVGGVVGGVGVDTATAAAYAFFYLLLPVSNALADLTSVAMTRRFLRWAANKEPGVIAVVGAFILDALWGLLCLLGLLYLLTLGLDLWQALSPTTLPLEWRAYWAEARADPRQGLALWLMALTTLLPTIVHCVVGVTAMLTHASRRRVEALDELAQICGTERFTEPRQRAIATKLVNADTYALCLGGVFLTIATYALWRVSAALLPHLSNWHLLFPS